MQIAGSAEAGRTALVTGANGFIGAYLVHELLRRGWSVFALGRSKNALTWRDRACEAIRAASEPGTELDLSRLRCGEVDFGRQDTWLSADVNLPRDGQAVLVHLAGDTKFVPLDADAQTLSNVDATVNVVTSLRPFISRAVHVSTAYVAGDRTGLIREDEADVGQKLNNHYEQTKLLAEIRMRRQCEELNLPLTIARPPIIVNDLAQGRASTFTHLNVMVEVVNRMQEFYGLEDGEVVSRVIRVPLNPAARPNLAPVDPIALSLALIVESPSAAGKTLHLCHPAPQTNVEILDLIAQVFGVKDKVQLQFVRELARPVSHTEEMIARSFKVYLPYLNGDKTFDLANTRAVIPQYDAMFKPMDIDYLRKVVTFERAQRRES